jgi:hypothetical protein
MSPDGQLVATASDDRTARIFHADGTGDAVELSGHGDTLTSVAWSPDSKRLATTSLDGTARIWNTAGGAALLILKHDGDVNEAAWSPDGKLVATAWADGTALVWDAANGNLVYSFEHPSPVLHVLWSRDGQRLVTALANGVVGLTNLASKSHDDDINLQAPAAVLAMAFQKDQQILTVAADNSMRTWELQVSALKDQLRAVNVDCLPRKLREQYLTEGDYKAALAGYQQCEADAGRQGSPNAAAQHHPDKGLAADETRVSVLVSPTDAVVDVDGHPLPRRDGAIDLVGKVGALLQVHVSHDTLTCNFPVTLQDAGPTRTELDLGHCPQSDLRDGGALPEAGATHP